MYDISGRHLELPTYAICVLRCQYPPLACYKESIRGKEDVCHDISLTFP